MQENKTQNSNAQEQQNQDPSRQIFSSSFAKQNNHQVPEIKLPKGGGALKGIDEKFEVNPVNGSNSVSIPLPVSPARAGFSPSLAIQYSSGGGNGLFGMGWGLGLPSIRRKTDKQLPLYNDNDESDTFIFAGAEDLIPKYEYIDDNGTSSWVKQEKTTTTHHIQEYRPRIEGSWLRIERWTELATRIIHWRTISTNNTISVYGDSVNSRIANPKDPDRQIFEWLISHSYDNMGNLIIYEYKKENLVGRANTPFEKNRTEDTISNRYLKRVHYGNRTHYKHNESLPSPSDFLFETVLDYGEHSDNSPNEIATWTARPDAFSSFRSGFDIRTYRLCDRVLLFHKFDATDQVQPAQSPDALLVSALQLNYQDYPDKDPSPIPLEGFTYLKEVLSIGYLYENGAYTQKEIPPLSFYYQAHAWDTTIHTLEDKAHRNLPTGINNSGYSWTDLYGEGISGILSEKNQAWYYQQNEGNGNFSPIELLSQKPSFQGLNQGLQFQDLEGSGERQLVNWGASPKGFFNYKNREKWEGFQSFEQIPNRNISNDPNARFIDLDGDGRPDLLITENDLFEWYPSEGKKGFGKANRLSKAMDEEEGARIVFSDQEQSIFLADMTGDGMTDIVRIKNGSVCYWANQGYGLFSAKITMANAPLFDYEGQFNPQYILLTDIDGSGTTDIAYLGKDHIHTWANHSGNSFATAPNIIYPFPTVDNQIRIDFVDLLGTGTPCLVWSSMSAKDVNTPLKYINLTANKKPHLLYKYENNTGAAAEFEYISSTHFYLADKKAGKPWASKLPFPVHVVCKTTATDYIRNTVFSSKYSYHHGYYDHLEREFRGFGRVEQLDTEDFNQIDALASNIHSDHFQVPTKSVSWYHTGASFKDKTLTAAFAAEYYSNPDPDIEKLLEGTILPNSIPDEAYHEAFRACKGLLLRQEVYSLDTDNIAQVDIPYGTSSNSYRVKVIQPHLGQRYASFVTVPVEAMSYNYERNPDDPRISQNLILATDDLGIPIKTASIIYPRINIPSGLPWMVEEEQKKIHASFTEITLTNDVDEDHTYRLRTACEEKIHEILGLTWAKGDPYFTPDSLEIDYLQGSTPIGFEQEATLPLGILIETRLSGHGKAFFLSNDLSTELPFRQQESLGIPSQSFQLASTSDLRNDLYDTNNGNLLTTSNLNLPSDGHFKEFNNNDWWIPSGKTIYDLNPSPTNPLLPLSATNFYIPLGVEDILGNQTIITFDEYKLFPTSTKDALENTMTTAYDYRVLQPNLVTDINYNQTAVAYDILGIVVKTAVMGIDAAGNVVGDTLVNPTTIMDYDFFSWQNTNSTSNPQPNYIHSKIREKHYIPNTKTIWQESYEYSDGGGEVIMAKVQTKAGKALKWDGKKLKEIDTKTRWIGNGRTIIDNKGNPIKQYEPYFSVTHEFEDAPELVEIGYSPILYYDAAGRNNRTVLPDGSLTRVEFDAWQNTSFDVNDTIAEVDNNWVAPDTRIATLVARHANTPTLSYLDCLGRTIYAENIAPNAAQNTAIFTQTDMAGRYSKVYDQLATAEIAAQAIGNYHTNRGISSYSRTNLLGEAIYTKTAVKGKSYALIDAMGRMLRIWDNPDSINQSLEFRTDYDVLHRPLATYVKQGLKDEICFAKTEYGETVPNSEKHNLRGQAYKSWDQVGIMTSKAFDFKGNPLLITRELTKIYEQTINWNLPPSQIPLEKDVFKTTSVYDALNRPTLTTLPDGTQLKPTYNKGGYLEILQADIMGQGTFKTFLAGQDYDAKGQKKWVKYGNKTITTYFYDAKTFRLANLLTVNKDAKSIQDLHYRYDPIGNIMEVRDDAQNTLYYDNRVILPQKRYEYDHLNRLIKATGREHKNTNYNPPSHKDFIHLQGLPHQHVQNAVGTYTQNYEYDAVDNILSMRHHTGQGQGNWTRTYEYAVDATNRLTKTKLGSNVSKYKDYDVHGNMTKMPHLQALTWNFADQLTHVELNNKGYNAYYNYDGDGQRIRKVLKNGNTKKERIYLGGLERYRVYVGGDLVEETWTVLIDGIAQVETKTIDHGSIKPRPLIRYQYSDHLGSATLETNEDAQTISYEEYHPYGTTAYSSYVNNSYSTKRYRFSNKERDDETGLYYFGMRYYAAWLGKWTSSDPGGFIDGLNLYRYVRNNPVNLTDPDGMSPDGWIRNKETGEYQWQEGVTSAENTPKGFDYVGVGASYEAFNGKTVNLYADGYWGYEENYWESAEYKDYEMAATSYGLGLSDEGAKQYIKHLQSEEYYDLAYKVGFDRMIDKMHRSQAMVGYSVLAFAFAPIAIFEAAPIAALGVGRASLSAGRASLSAGRSFLNLTNQSKFLVQPIQSMTTKGFISNGLKQGGINLGLSFLSASLSKGSVKEGFYNTDLANGAVGFLTGGFSGTYSLAGTLGNVLQNTLIDYTLEDGLVTAGLGGKPKKSFDIMTDMILGLGGLGLQSLKISRMTDFHIKDVLHEGLNVTPFNVSLHVFEKSFNSVSPFIGDNVKQKYDPFNEKKK